MQASQRKEWLLWASCLIVGMYYCYEMMQLTLISTISTELVKEYSLSVQQLSWLSSAYLYACAAGILPAGLLLDRYPIKPLLILTAIMAVAGAFLTANAEHFWLAVTGRILTGFSSDFAFLGYLTLVSKFFQGRKAAFARSIIYSLGALGCILSQTPITLLVEQLGLQRALTIIAGIGGLILLLIIFGLGKTTAHLQTHHTRVKPEFNLLQRLKTVLSKRQNFLCAFYACVSNMPLMLMGALWSKIYLTKIHHLSALQASYINSSIFWGALLGAPLLGWLAGRFKLHYMMIGFALLGAGSWLTLAVLPNNLHLLFCLFFILGVLVNTQLFSVMIVSKINPNHIEATSLSVVSIANNAGGALLQIFFGWLLIAFRPENCHVQSCLYSANSFDYIFAIIAVHYLVSALVAFLIRKS